MGDCKKKKKAAPKKQPKKIKCEKSKKAKEAAEKKAEKRMKYEKYEKSKKKKTNCEKSKKAKEAAEKKAAQKSKFGEIEKAKKAETKYANEKAEKAHANKTKIFAEHVHKLTIKTKSVKHARKKGVKKLAKAMKKLPVTVAKPTEPKATGTRAKAVAGTKANGHSKVNAKVKDYPAYKAAKARRGAK